ncbi:hypothetical protein BH11ACT4_BH11ACT4_21130 [soil metagenome]
MSEVIPPEQLQCRIAALLGTSEDIWEHAVATRPEYVAAALSLGEVPQRSGHLTPRVRALVQLALAAAVTHLRESRVRTAMQEALAAGATKDEILEVLMVTSTLGVHGMNAEVLAEVLAERGTPVPDELSARQEGIRAEYTAVRGYWRDFLNPTLALAPDFLEAYLEFSGAPWRRGLLEPKVREFLYLAFDTSPTHLHLSGLRVHMHNALDHGATPEEIVEIMALAAAMGLETLAVGVETLADVGQLTDNI